MSRFINPYSFIPFAEGPERSSRKAAYANPAELMTGSITVRLIPKTSLIIPDGHPVDKDGKPVDPEDRKTHKHYSFFKDAEGQYCIPGSSLRGMLRSVFEAASNSCLPFLQDDEYISTRTPVYGAWKDRGLLKYDSGQQTWKLYRAVLYGANQTPARKQIDPKQIQDGEWNGCHYGDQVRFNLRGEEAEPDPAGSHTGFLQFQRPINAKKRYHVSFLEPAEEPENVEITETAIESLKQAIRVSRGKEENRSTYSTALKMLEKPNGRMVPVWYKLVGNVCYLSISSIGRVPQRNKWKEIMQSYGPCTDPDCQCAACQLFGTAQAGKAKGRIRFGDAAPIHAIRPDQLLHDITLPILSTGRPSAFEFYLRKPNAAATYWNFDYHVIGTQNNAKYIANTQLMPRGRKMYWHSNPAGKTSNEKRSSNNTMLEIIKAGEQNSFRFRIGFDRITEEQLQGLLWTVTLGDNHPDSPLQHKIGHGRPLGYGAVKLVVEEVWTRKLETGPDGILYRLDSRPVPDRILCPWYSRNRTAIDSIIKMSDIHSAGACPVVYPIGVRNQNRAIFEWFGQNRGKNGPAQLLPDPLDDRIDLASIENGIMDPGQGAKPNRPPAPRPAAGNRPGIQTDSVQTVTITRYNQGGNAYCKMQNGESGFLNLRGDQAFAASHPAGSTVTVRVTAPPNPLHNSWQLRLYTESGSRKS